MQEYIILFLFIITGYLLGSIPFGYIIAKRKNIDITKQGSGNIGATNVSRSLGPKYALLVAVLDILKALLPIYIASYYISNDWYMLFVIITPMIGHIFPIWLNFKGGKAVSPVLGDGLVPCDGWDCTSDDLTGMVGSIFDLVAFQIVPALAVIGFVIAGIIMITSGGDPAKFNQGKSAMIAIAVGLIIVYLAWAIVKLFIDIIGGAEWTKMFFQ
jgi:acyl-phosphate glycerol 3-phosphate acyltransferase